MNKTYIPKNHPGENDKIGNHNLSACSTGIMNDATIIGRPPLLLTSNNKVIELTGEAALAESIYRNMTNLQVGTGDTMEIESACLLSGTWENNYFHWTSEYAPQLIGAREFQENSGTTLKLIVGSNPPDWKLEFIKHFGFSESDIVSHEGKLNVKNLIVTNGHRQDYIPHPDVLNWFKKEARNNLGHKNPVFPNKDGIYVSRQKARGKMVENYGQLSTWLEEHNIQPVYFEDMSYSEEVSLMKSVDLIIAPHGAGLTSMIYADSPRIIEIFSSSIFRSTYFVMSGVLEYKYQYLTGETVSRKELREQNIHVDIEELDYVFDKLGLV